mgnify:CR=1 FL=1
MLRWTITFIIIALIAGFLGFSGIAGAATSFAKIAFFILFKNKHGLHVYVFVFILSK